MEKKNILIIGMMFLLVSTISLISAGSFGIGDEHENLNITNEGFGIGNLKSNLIFDAYVNETVDFNDTQFEIINNNLSIDDVWLFDFIGRNNYVPYTGATSNVDLGSQNLSTSGQVYSEVDGKPLNVTLSNAGTTAVNGEYVYYTEISDSDDYTSFHKGYLQGDWNWGTNNYVIATPDTYVIDYNGDKYNIHDTEGLNENYAYAGYVHNMGGLGPPTYKDFTHYYRIPLTDFNNGVDNWEITGGSSPAPDTSYDAFEQITPFKLDSSGIITQNDLTVGDKTVGKGTISTDNLKTTGLEAKDGTFYFNPDPITSGAGSRFVWDADTGSFRAGDPNGDSWNASKIGDYSFAGGEVTEASGDSSTAFGYGTTASGQYSTAFGYGTTASGFRSTAFGRDTTASGDHSTAFGEQTIASGYKSTAFGYSTTASGDHSTAFGRDTTASGGGSLAAGGYFDGSEYFDGPTASADGSFAFGNEFNNSLQDSFAVGFGSKEFSISDNEGVTLGSNTHGGMNAGDINVSTLYYDTQVAKSPIISCSNEWCSVDLPENKKTYYIEKDKNWNLLEMTDEKGDSMITKGKVSTDENGYIVSTTETEIQKILNKTFKLRDKEKCYNQGYKYDGSCYEIIKQDATYSEAVKEVAINKTETVEENYTCIKLNDQLEEYETTCTNETTQKTNEIESYEYKFKEDYDWNEDIGYYKEVRQEVIV